MTTAEKLQRLTEWHTRYLELDAAMDALLAVGLSPEAPIHDAAFKVFDEYTKAVAREIGDEWEWLS